MAFPRRFREAYGADMAHQFEVRSAQALARGGPAGLLLYLCRTALDVAWNAPLQRLSAWGADLSPAGDPTVTTFLRDLRFALRALIRQPGLSGAIVVTLGLGTGATAALFAVFDGAVLRPLPYPDSGRMVMLRVPDARFGPLSFAPPYLRDLRERVTLVEGLAGFTSSWEHTLTEPGEPRHVVAAYVTDGLWEQLGVVPLAGRDLSADEHAVGGPPAALVSRRLWERHFGGEAPLGGQTLRLGGETLPIVGVLPDVMLPVTASQVSQLSAHAEIWLPVGTNQFAELRAAPVMHVIGRLPPSIPPGRVQAELDAVARSLAGDYPESGGWTTITATPLREVVVQDARATVLTLFGAAAFLLLVGCANVANLLLARATSRGGELALRRSLGAGRRQILGQLLTESLVVAALGAGLGLLLAWWLAGLLGSSLVGLPPTAEIRLDGRTTTFVIVLAAFTALLFGLVPALHGAGSSAGDLLRGASRVTGRGHRLRGALVSAEVGLAVTLLVGAGLLGRSFWNLVNVDPGFRAEGLLQVAVPLPADRYPGGDARRAFLEEALVSLGAVPGVVEAAAVNRFPLSGGNVLVQVEAEGSVQPEGELPLVDRRVSTPGYFELMDIPLREGRGFGPEDDAGGLPTAIVTEAFARRVWADGAALERRVRLVLRGGPGPWLTVVGVAADVRHHGLDRPPEPEIHVPYAQAPVESMTLLLRTGGEPTALLGGVREALWRIDPELPLDVAGPVTGLVTGSVTEPRVRTLILNGFAALALLLAAVGIYGVISYSVAQRTRETGVRIALGAPPGRVVRRVLGQGLRPAAWGVLLGLGGAWALGRLLSGFLYGVEAGDPVTLGAVAALLFLVALSASWLPARRAARIDPVDALRSD